MTRAKQAAIYCRVSTDDQSCERQERDLLAFAERAGYDVAGIYKETASGTKNERQERNKILALSQARKIDAILVTELTRWGRSTADLLSTVEQLASQKVSLRAETGLDFDLSTPQGRLILTLLAGLSQFERDLTAQRTRSGLAAARARGKVLGRPHGFNPSDKYADRVLSFRSAGRSIQWIADDLHISTTTVQRILKRNPGFAYQ